MSTFTTTLVAVMAAPIMVVSAAAATADSAVATRNISVAKGQSQMLELPSNSSTGYSWQLTSPLPQDSAASVKIAALPPKDNNVTVVGVPSTSLVTITGVRSGTTECKLVYARSNDKKEDAQKTISLKINVK